MSDLEFVQDDNENTEDVAEPKVRQRVPSEYIPVKLSSMGKLDAPSVLNVKDYNGEDVLILATANDRDFLRKLVDVINNVVYEGFDCSYLHEYELEELMLNILGNFWTPVIHDFPYPYEDEEFETLDEERRKLIADGKENLSVDIPIASIKTNTIKPDFKEPITIKRKDGLTVQFILPRIRHHFIAQDYIEKKYAEEYQKFSYIEQINEIENPEQRQKKFQELSMEERTAFMDFSDRRGRDYIIAKQAQLLKKFASKPLASLDDQLKHYSKISLHFWKQYNEYVDKYLTFGVDHDIKMKSPITDKEVIRRCQFRPVDYVPSNELPDSGEYTVLFGE